MVPRADRTCPSSALCSGSAKGGRCKFTGTASNRGFTYIDDIAHGTILALKPVGHEIINLGGHEVITINNLIRLIEDVVGKRPSSNMVRLTWQICARIGQM